MRRAIRILLTLTVLAIGIAVAAAWWGHRWLLQPIAQLTQPVIFEVPRGASLRAVAAELHVSTARVSAALQPLFAAGHAETSSPAFAAAARALGVSTNQLDTALMHAKQSLAQSS